MTTQLYDVNKKVEEGNLSLGNFEIAKRKMAAENSNLLRAIEDLENNANMLTKCKDEFSNDLSEAKKVIDKEIEEKKGEMEKSIHKYIIIPPCRQCYGERRNYPFEKYEYIITPNASSLQVVEESSLKVYLYHLPPCSHFQRHG